MVKPEPIRKNEGKIFRNLKPIIMKIKISKNETFIFKAKNVHGDKYDYSLVKYVRADKKVKIVCETHGVFEQTPSSHLQGYGCPFCARKRLTREQYIEKANKIHRNKYDYSKCEVNQYTKKLDLITITCPKHGDFYQRMDLHLKGHGCPICGRKKRKSKNARKKKLMDSTSSGDFILKVRYTLKENPAKIEMINKGFKNKVDAENHQKEIEMFLDMINADNVESRVELLTKTKLPEKVEEKTKDEVKVIAIPKAPFSQFLRGFLSNLFM